MHQNTRCYSTVCTISFIAKSIIFVGLFRRKFTNLSNRFIGLLHDSSDFVCFIDYLVGNLNSQVKKNA